MTTGAGRLGAAYADALHELLTGSHLVEPDGLPDLVERAVAHLGVSEAVIYLVDYEQQTLTPFPPDDATAREPQSVESTVAGRAFQRVEPPVGSGSPCSTGSSGSASSRW
jgi:hypothetical protein